MTMRILKSELTNVAVGDFDTAVQVHVENLRQYREHQAHIARGSTEHHPYPPPITHPLVNRAIDPVTGKADYEIVNDDPDPLRVKKNALLQKIAEAEAEMAEAILPPGKLRLATLEPEKNKDKLAALNALNIATAKLMAKVEDLTLAQIDKFEITLEAK